MPKNADCPNVSVPLNPHSTSTVTAVIATNKARTRMFSV